MLPFVLSCELRTAASKVEDVLKGARMLLPNIRFKRRLVRIDLLKRAAGLAIEKLALIRRVTEAVGRLG